MWAWDREAGEVTLKQILSQTPQPHDTLLKLILLEAWEGEA